MGNGAKRKICTDGGRFRVPKILDGAFLICIFEIGGFELSARLSVTRTQRQSRLAITR